MSKVGDIDEPGFVRGLFRKGFTPEKCLSELLQNTFDAGAVDCKFMITTSTISIIDDGVGMNEYKLGKMFSMFHENHKDDYSMGVSGVGAKPATAILSSSDGTIINTSSVIIYTHTENEKYFKATVPWNEITEQLRYIGMIKIEEMDHSEIQCFCADRSHHKTGTTIVFRYNEPLHHIIELQFNEDSKKMKLDDKWGFIFGKGELNISYEYNETFYPSLPMYDYFKDERPYYYTDIDTEAILYYKDKDNNDRFLWQAELGGDYYEFSKHGKGYSWDLSILSPSEKTRIRNWKFCGRFEVQIGMRKNKYLFNEDDVSMTLNPFETQHSTLCDYDALFMTYNNGNKDFVKSQLSKVPIVRNGQVVTRIDIDGNKASSARASAENSIRIIDLRCEISYRTTSAQDNPLDICMGIQENKNQHSRIIPVPLSRLLAELKMRKFCKIKEYFTRKIDEYKQSLYTNSTVEPVVVASEPVTSEPVVVASEPVTSEPVVVASEPVTSEPVVVASEPVTSEPVVVASEPVTLVTTTYNNVEDTETSSLSDNEQHRDLLQTSDTEDNSSTTNEIEEYILGSDLITLLQNVLESIDENTQYNGKYIDLFDIIQSM